MPNAVVHNIVDSQAKSYQNSSLFTLSQGFEGFDSTTSHLIKGYLPRNAFGVVYGASGSYKSFHALNWACSVASGKEWNNKKVTQCNVLYIAGEGGIGVPRRIKAWSTQHISGQQVKNLYRINHPVIFNQTDEVSALIQTIHTHQSKHEQEFGLIIIDTLARCFGHACENKAEDMNAFIAACDRIKAETEATILVVHHSGKDADKGARGSSALRAACDFEYKIERLEKQQSYRLTCTKAKDDEEAPRQIFDLKESVVLIDEDKEPICSLAAVSLGKEDSTPTENQKPQSAQKALLIMLKDMESFGSPISRTGLRERYKREGYSPNNFSRTLTILVNQGLITEGENDFISSS